MSTVHSRTPNVVAVEGRGLPTRQVAYLRSQASDPAVALITRQRHNVIGHLVEQWDPRLFDHAPKANQATLCNLAGQPLHSDSADGGWRLALPGLAGETRQRWDERGNHWRMTYDPQLRPVTLEENGQAEVDTFTYADATADANHNLRGQLLEQVDPSGTLHLDSYGLLGQPLRETRTFHDGKALTSRRIHDPLGAVLEQTDAGEHQQQWRYDLAGQLKQVLLQLEGQTDWQPVLHDAQYNAAGQIIEQRVGNDVVSDWTYDPASARLLKQRARKDETTVLVDFEYTHDPVGNVTRILDHAFTATHFANQRIDGQRAFGYDSLYRLLSASGYDDGPPADIPGLPQPTDPNNRLNYRQTYEYDDGGNLTKLIHVREGASHTRQMFIDPNSNRGVRWAPGDPTPSFDTLFDRHGNLQTLQPGQALQWNARDQVACVTLLNREDGPNDEEHYRYSQGIRVYKRHETHTATHSHFQDVRYLPGLEIRTRDNGEELHVLTLDGGFASVRCLHWVTGKPVDIKADQLRYSLEDHLGSSVMELDQQAQLISHEGYYPFGATAWMTAPSSVEVGYRTVRYSGKEMDASGLYYYGTRYYAPWLQRWVSSDPAGDVDGLNRYAFVGNNPLNYVDDQGAQKTPYQLKNRIVSGFQFLSDVQNEMETLTKQLYDLGRPRRFRINVLKNIIYQAGSVPVGWFTSSHAAGEAANLFPGFSGTHPHLSGALFGLTLGNVVAQKSTGLYAQLMAPLKLNVPIVPEPAAFSAEAIGESSGLSKASRAGSILSRTPTGDEMIGAAIELVSKTVGAYIPAVGEAMALAKVSEDATRAEEGLFRQELDEIESTLEQLHEATLKVAAQVNTDFAELGIREFYDKDRFYVMDLILRRVGTGRASSIHQNKLSPFKEDAISSIKRSQLALNRYRRQVAIKNVR